MGQIGKGIRPIFVPEPIRAPTITAEPTLMPMPEFAPAVKERELVPATVK